MAAKCKKCDPHEICEECPEWIFTLADLIMCMMGLFVLLWVLKPSPNPPTGGTADGDPKKQEIRQNDVLTAIRREFGYIPEPNSGEPVNDATTTKKLVLAGAEGPGKQETPEPGAEGVAPLVESIREGKPSNVGTRVLFDAGETKLTPDDERVLDQIAKEIVGSRFIVIVKGHASRDDFGEHGTQSKFMEASLKRAQAAADYLTTRGVSPDVLRVQGCSTFEPVRQRAYSAEAQQANRRVEVFTTDTVVRDLEDPRNTSAKSVE